MNTQTKQETFTLTQDGETLTFLGNEANCKEDFNNELCPTETFFDWCKNSYRIVPAKGVLNITPGEWIFHSNNNSDYLDIDGASRVTSICLVDEALNPGEAESNAKAICTAVNNTYGKGYNPAAMEELYKALERIIDRIKENEFQGNFPSAFERAETALQTLKL